MADKIEYGLDSSDDEEQDYNEKYNDSFTRTALATREPEFSFYEFGKLGPENVPIV